MAFRIKTIPQEQLAWHLPLQTPQTQRKIPVQDMHKHLSSQNLS